MKLLLIYVFFSSLLFSFDNYFYNNGKKVELIPFSNLQRNITNNLQYYKKNNGLIVGVSNDILVKFKEFNQDILDKYSLTIEKKYSPFLYLVSQKDGSLTLDISNKLYLESAVEYAHPNFRKKVSFR